MELLLISLKNICYVETKFWDKINQIIGHTALISWDWNTSSTSELSVVQLSASCASKNKVVRMRETKILIFIGEICEIGAKF